MIIGCEGIKKKNKEEEVALGGERGGKFPRF